MRFSAGRSLRISRRIESPPKPESKTPIGCSVGSPVAFRGLDGDIVPVSPLPLCVTLGLERCLGCGSAEVGAGIIASALSCSALECVENPPSRAACELASLAYDLYFGVSPIPRRSLDPCLKRGTCQPAHRSPRRVSPRRSSSQDGSCS